MGYHLKGVLKVIEGSRSTPIWEDYRPVCNFGGMSGSVRVVEMEKEKLHPGESTEGKLEFLAPQVFMNKDFKLQLGDRISLYEGSIKTCEFGIEEVNLNQNNGDGE